VYTHKLRGAPIPARSSYRRVSAVGP
jgi:hypothetical protein